MPLFDFERDPGQRMQRIFYPNDYANWKRRLAQIDPLQVWVDVAYTRYRRAYQVAFPDEVLGNRIVSHTMNRRVAVLKGFQFVRLTPTSRAANSSSAFSEGWGVALHSTPEQRAANRRRGAFIQYADLTELMLMLNMRLGGGVMDAVTEAKSSYGQDRHDIAAAARAVPCPPRDNLGLSRGGIEPEARPRGRFKSGVVSPGCNSGSAGACANSGGTALPSE